MSDEKLTPERAVRLLREHAASFMTLLDEENRPPPPVATVLFANEIALIAGLLADHIERIEQLVKVNRLFDEPR